jgi:hypothetical protein
MERLEICKGTVMDQNMGEYMGKLFGSSSAVEQNGSMPHKTHLETNQKRREEKAVNMLEEQSVEMLFVDELTAIWTAMNLNKYEQICMKRNKHRVFTVRVNTLSIGLGAGLSKP